MTYDISPLKRFEHLVYTLLIFSGLAMIVSILMGNESLQVLFARFGIMMFILWAFSIIKINQDEKELKDEKAQRY